MDMSCTRLSVRHSTPPHCHRQMGLAIGVVEVTHNIGNWLGKVAVDVSEPLGGGDWHATLWFAFGLCVVSALLVAPCFWLLGHVESAR